MAQHAKLSPSAAARWMRCPGSIALTKDLPDQSSPYAEEGTTAHKLAEMSLLTNIEPCHIIGDFPGDMRDEVLKYVEYVWNIEGNLFIEKRINLQKWVPGGFGTADALILNAENRVLHVIDLKYGMGKVNAENNEQLLMYALGAADKVKDIIDKVVMHIVQPRINYFGTAEIEIKELFEFGKKVKAAAKLCLTDNAPLNPSEKACRWCKAKHTCPALYEHNLEVIGKDFEPLAASEMTLEQMQLVLQNKPLIDNWLKSIEKHVFELINSGQNVPGYKIVEGRSLRKYTGNAQEVLHKLLGDDAFNRDLITVTKAEKLIGKKQFAELNITHKPTGKPVLAAESDKRPAITPAIDDFNKL